MRNVLVTGASGFVGGHVVEALRRRGLKVRCLTRQPGRLEFLRPLEIEPAAGDVTLPDTLELALEGVDAVVHCAGLTRAVSRARFFEANEAGPRNLYAACRKRGRQILKIVHISSLAAIGPSPGEEPVTEESHPSPVSDYGDSKLAGQRAAEACMADLPVSIVLPPAVYGPRDAAFLAYFKAVARGRVPLIGGADRRLSLVYVKDLAEAVAVILTDRESAGQAFLVDDGSVHTWTGVAAEIGRAMNRPFRPLSLPVSIVRGMGILGDLYAAITGTAPLINSQKVRELLQDSWTCSSDRIRGRLGFRAQFSLERGIAETLSWYRDHQWL